MVCDIDTIPAICGMFDADLAKGSIIINKPKRLKAVFVLPG